MNRNGNAYYSSHVDGGLISHLHGAGLMSALVDMRSFRVKSYWSKPKVMLQDGWRLVPGCDPRRTMPREWMLGDAQSGQRICFDRENGLVRLLTYVRHFGQEITLDIESGRVLQNRLAQASV